MSIIQSIRITDFVKKNQILDWSLNQNINILVGDMASGKSSLLRMIQNTSQAELQQSNVSVSLFDKQEQFTSTLIDCNHLSNEKMCFDIANALHSLNEELLERLTTALSIFFNPIGKKVTVEYLPAVFIYNNKIPCIKLSFNDNVTMISPLSLIGEHKEIVQQLSHGELRVIHLLTTIIAQSINNDVIMLDNPETGLHIDVQEYLIRTIKNAVPQKQFIIVTNSPAMIMNGWNDSYVDIAELIQNQ